MFCSLSSSCQFFCASFPPYFLTLTCNLSPFCHQSFSSFLHCSSLFLFTNAFPSLISWNPSLITPHHRLSHLVHKCVINDSLHIQKQLFMSFRLTSFQRVNRNKAKKNLHYLIFSSRWEWCTPPSSGQICQACIQLWTLGTIWTADWTNPSAFTGAEWY